MKKGLLFLAAVICLAYPARADDFFVVGGTVGNYEYLVWDDTEGSTVYALISGTEGAGGPDSTSPAGLSLDKILIILGE